MLTNNVVTQADYAGLAGFGGGELGTAQALEDLNKALGTTGTGGLGTQFTDGSALRVESLEATLKVVTHRDEHIKFWKKVAKLPAYNTVEEYNRLDSYGADVEAFFEEGGLPGAEDAEYSRQTGLVKFLGTTRVINHPLTLVRPAHGDVVARETTNGVSWLLGKMENALFFANDQYNPLAFKGLRQLMMEGQLGGDSPVNTHVIDLRGQAMTEEHLETAAQIIADNYGRMTDIFLGVKAMGDLAKTFFPKERVGLPAPTNGRVGVPITQFASQNGLVEFNPDVFLKQPGNFKATADTDAPAAPAAPTTAVSASTYNLFTASDAGDYYYKVSAINYKGESLATVTAAAQTVAAGEKVSITITRVTTSPAASAYKIYRSAKNGSADSCQLIATVKDAGTGATQVAVDENWTLPGTTEAFGLDLDPNQVISFKQLAPLMKMPLATIATSVRFMILLYGVLQLYAPKKTVLFKNIGQA